MLTLSTRLSALIHSIGMLVADLARNFVVIGLLLFGFASALSVVQREVGTESGFTDMGTALMSLLRQVPTPPPLILSPRSDLISISLLRRIGSSQYQSLHLILSS